jgi:hypothetical protein
MERSMKKHLVTALLSMSCFWVDAASAARFSFLNITKTTSAKVEISNGDVLKVSPALQGLLGRDWVLSNLSNSRQHILPKSANDFGRHSEFNTYFSEANIENLQRATYFLSIAAPPGNMQDVFTVVAQDDSNNNDVPVPAALWLFGSAVFGIHGLVRRKTRIVFTA